jgi:hypothetical protein
MVRRLEGTHGLAHKGEISGQWAYSKNEGLLRVIPWFIKLSVFVEQERRKTTSTCYLIPSRNFDNSALT